MHAPNEMQKLKCEKKSNQDFVIAAVAVAGGGAFFTAVVLIKCPAVCSVHCAKVDSLRMTISS